MAIQLQDLNRRNLPLQKSKVREILPEYFVADYPTFVTFLEKYYQFLDSDGTYAFDTQIHQLFSTRDIDQTPQSLLDTLGKELGQQTSAISLFSDPRYSIRRFGELYRAKGTLVGAEQFFRSFFQIDIPETLYPKENLFTVGSSQIGYENSKVIQDYRRNQIYSILYKVPFGLTQWQDLYKDFVHPAGYYFSVDVLLQSEVDLDLRTMPTVLFDSAVGPSLIAEVTSVPATSFEQFTTLQADVDTGIIYRANPEETVEKYADFQLDSLDAGYDNLAQLFTPNSFKFDDSNASADSAAPDFSMTFETFDQEMFDSYGKAY
jgi:hypothetical protein